MKRVMLIASMCLVAFFATAATALAVTAAPTSPRVPVSHDYVILKSLLKWSRLGGDPLVNGGFPTKAAFADGLVNNERVADALRLVVRLDGYPAKITQLAIAQAEAGTVYAGKLDRNVGWMSYGNPNGKIKVQRAKWVGAGAPKTWYVKVKWDLSKPVMKDGTLQIKTVRYKVAAPKACGNIHVRPLTPTYRPYTPPEPVEHTIFVRKINYETCQLIPGWGISAVLDGTTVTATTGCDWVAIGDLAEGKDYSVTEETRQDWTAMTPSTVTGTMGSADVYITFKNKYCAPRHELKVCIVAEITKRCQSSSFEATLKASVKTHSDDDALSYSWTINGKPAGTERCITVELAYGVEHTATVTVTDAAGNQATATKTLCVAAPKS